MASEAASYPIMSLVDIARIPEDAFPRFLSEFPVIVRSARGLIEMVEAIHEASGIDKPDDASILSSIGGARWIDDDKGTATVNIVIEDETGEQRPLMSAHGSYRTGEFNLRVEPTLVDDGAEPAEQPK